MYSKKAAVFNWSGGKDSTLALYYVLRQAAFDVRYLLTTINTEFDRVAMHGLRTDLLMAQVNALAIPLLQVGLPEMPDMESYETVMTKQLLQLKEEGIEHAIYGDIFLEDLKNYREKQLSKIGLNAVFPLWKRNSLELVKEFIDLGFKTVVVCTQDGLQDFCGRIIDHNFLADLPKNIDPCGENGEFHTFVFDGPIFNNAVKFEVGERVFKEFPKSSDHHIPTGYWYIDLF